MESLLFVFLVMDLHYVGNSEIAFHNWQVHALCVALNGLMMEHLLRVRNSSALN